MINFSAGQVSVFNHFTYNFGVYSNKESLYIHLKKIYLVKNNKNLKPVVVGQNFLIELKFYVNLDSLKLTSILCPLDHKLQKPFWIENYLISVNFPI